MRQRVEGSYSSYPQVMASLHPKQTQGSVEVHLNRVEKIIFPHHEPTWLFPLFPRKRDKKIFSTSFSQRWRLRRVKQLTKSTSSLTTFIMSAVVSPFAFASVPEIPSFKRSSKVNMAESRSWKKSCYAVLEEYGDHITVYWS